ncbi:hypothetical protein GCK72_009208 [Caenorhabditis remanei]|uniref:Domain of unknown function WSN domain-containing protein n=1 Tax=Caenorhabditis remanei TaxID=31234 RepID=A0A6A5H1Y3_CAERE|nr:hypothetical protein GCK72_009208 [Caenorhabditis remanei]KAF1760955.1 hypothetical protein GCK72_009208 [Caenorhabditis remanei]
MRIKLLFLFFMGLAMASSRDTASSSLPKSTIKKFDSVTDHADYVSIDPHYSPLTKQIPNKIKGFAEDGGSSRLSTDIINRYRSFKESADNVGPSRLSTDIINQYRSFKDSADTTNHQTDRNHPPPTLHENMPSRRKRSISAYSSALFRLRRSSNDVTFSTLQSRIAALARVVTGVSLYNGLVDKSISSDQAITELMNLGSIQLKDLETFDNKKVEAFVKNLKEVSSKMGTQSVTLEKQIVDLYTMKNVWNGSKNFETIPDEASFKGLQYLENLDLTVLENFKVGTDSQKSLETLTNAAKAVVDAIEKGNALKTLKQMTPFHQFTQLVEHYSNSKPGDIQLLTPANTAPLKTNLKMLQGFSSKTEVLSTLSRIASSGMEASTDRMHTSGFINGHRDLNQLVKDVGNAWLQNSLGTFDLKEGLSVFTGLAEKMSALDEKWNSARTKTVRRSLQTAKNLEYSSNLVKYNPDSLDTAFQSFQKFPAVLQLLTNNLKGLSKDFIKLLKVVEIVYSISRSKSLESSKTHLLLLKNGEKVKDVVGRIMQQSSFYASVSTHPKIIEYKEFFDFLKTLNEDFTSLSAATQFVIDLRNLKDEQSFETDITTASSAVSGSSKHISTIRSKIEEITKSETGKKLVEFKELVKFSKPLGDSSEALSRVQKVLEKKKALLDFVENGHLVEEAVELIPAPMDQFEVRKDWAGFDELSSKILDQLDKIQKWIDGLVKSEDLDSYGSTLEKLSGLGDVDLEMNRRLAAVDFLQQQIIRFNLQSPKIVKFKETISPLESLNLEFSKFDASLSTMSSTLTGLKNVGGKAVNSTTMAAGLIGEKEESDNFWYIVIATSIVVVVIAIVLAVGIIYCGWFKECRNKMKGKRKPKNKTTPSVTPVTPNTDTGKTMRTTPIQKDDKKVVKPPSTGKSKVASSVAKPAGNNKSRQDNKNKNDQKNQKNQKNQKDQKNQKNQNTQKRVPSSSKKNQSGRGNNSNRNNQNDEAPVAPPAGSNRTQRNNQNAREIVTVQPGNLSAEEFSAKNKSSYMESQSDDDTLRCVKSITNDWC